MSRLDPIRLLPLLFLTGLFTAPFLQAADFNLTVFDGSGSGVYQEGSVVHIAAYPPPHVTPEATQNESTDPYAADKIFDRWSGDVEALKDPYAERTTLLMPAADLNIQAEYKDSERWLAPRVVTYFPEGHQGVIFMFHGGGGTAVGSGLLPATEGFIKEAVSRGIAVVSVASWDRGEGRWDEALDAADNLDMQRVAALRERLIARGLMYDDDPNYLVGISNGGGFTSRWTLANQAALGFPVAAAAIYIGSVDAGVMNTSMVPTVFALRENDTAEGGIINPAARQSFDQFIARGVPSQLWMSTPSPVNPERFWNIEGLSLNDSEAIYDILKTGGFLDNDDFLITNPSYSGWQVPLAGYAEYFTEIEWELIAAYAEHGFMVEFHDKVLDFLVNPTTVIEASPVVTDLSPTSGSVYSIVTISGENFYNIADVRFNGVSVSDFEVISGTTIITSVPAGASTGVVEVVNQVGTAVSSVEFVVDGPEINAIEPQIGGVGTLVKLTGVSFSDLVAVRVGGAQATEILGHWPQSIWFYVPEGAVTGPIEVETVAGSGVSLSNFTVIAPPVVDQVSQNYGPVGTTLILNGSGFAGGTTKVQFGSVPAPDLTIDSDSQLTVVVPEGAVSAKIRVINEAGYATSPRYFIVTQ